MSSSQQISFIIWICLVILMYILGVLQIYAYYRFKSIKYLIIVQKRYPLLVQIEAIVSVICLFITFPLWTNIVFQAMHSGINDIDILLEYFGLILSTYTTHFIANIEAGRLWLISFDLHYLYFNAKWKTQIDEKFAEQNWYLHNKSKYGNKYFIMKRVFIYWFIAATMSTLFECITHSVDPNYMYISGLFDAVVFCTPMCIAIYLYYKCPKNMKDNFFFHYEFKATTILFSTGLISYFLSQIIHAAGYIVLSWTIIILLAVWTLSFPSLFSTFWITNKILSDKMWIKKRFYSKDMIIMNEIHCQNDKDNEENKNNEKNLSHDEKLLNILKDDEKFELFILWMYKEFSSESILCFIELIQYKQFITNYLENTINNIVIEKSIGSNCILYETIPKSSIIYMNDSNTDNDTKVVCFKQIAHLLFEKYIKFNAELEVNISSDLRNKYYNLEKIDYEMDTIKLVYIFDDVIMEMFSFIIQSLVRYHHPQ